MKVLLKMRRKVRKCHRTKRRRRGQKVDLVAIMNEDLQTSTVRKAWASVYLRSISR